MFCYLTEHSGENTKIDDSGEHSTIMKHCSIMKLGRWRFNTGVRLFRVSDLNF